MTLLEIITAACEGTGNRVGKYGHWVQITTQHLDRHNDMLWLFAEEAEEEGFVRLTDGLEIEEDLTMLEAKSGDAHKHILKHVALQLEDEPPPAVPFIDDGPTSWFINHVVRCNPADILQGIETLAAKLSEISNTFEP